MSSSGILVVAMVVMMIVMCGGMLVGAGLGIRRWIQHRRESGGSTGEPTSPS